MWLAFGIVLILVAAVGCSSKITKPLEAKTDFVTDSRILAKAIKDAAAEWAALGCAAASLVTVNEVTDGAVKVYYVPRDHLNDCCGVSQETVTDGCSWSTHDDKWDRMYIPDDLTDERRRVVLLHELGHIFAGYRGHIRDSNVVAIMTKGGTSNELTDADYQFMAEHTTMLDPEDLVNHA